MVTGVVDLVHQSLHLRCQQIVLTSLTILTHHLEVHLIGWLYWIHRKQLYGYWVSGIPTPQSDVLNRVDFANDTSNTSSRGQLKPQPVDITYLDSLP